MKFNKKLQHQRQGEERVISQKRVFPRLLHRPKIHCPAKINLYLNTLRKYPNGFHEIESIFHAVSLYDYIEIASTPEALKGKQSQHLKITLSPKSTFPVAEKQFLKNNILDQVYRYFRDNYQIPEIEMVLTKNIPIGAGLGGGSSDAAGLIVGFNKLFNLGLSRPEMMTIGAKFGSDVSFFFIGGMAWVGGQGEMIEKHPLALNQPILLCYSDCFIETARSYREFNTLNPEKSSDSLRKKLSQIVSQEGDISKKREKMFNQIGINLFNSFEKNTIKSFPNLKKTYQILKKNASFSLMSGSGSCFFGLFHDRIKMDRTYSYLRKIFPHTYKVRLIPSGIRVTGLNLSK